MLVDQAHFQNAQDLDISKYINIINKLAKLYNLKTQTLLIFSVHMDKIWNCVQVFVNNPSCQER